MENKICFRRFGTMLDCSRNAVPNIKSLKKWIDLTADLGYNMLQLYTEDTYEVDGNPYFGYMRGRFSKEELKEIDAYAAEKRMELIPCIQTLAHLSALSRWSAYASHMDTLDTLLAGDEAVYDLIDSMFATIAACFSTKTVHIGMDEAHMVGRGKYYDLHGDRNHTEILLEHLKRVSEIGKKYGFSLIMYSDMFFRMASGGEYYSADARIDRQVRELLPDNVRLIYWDYYSTDKSHYDKMLKAHAKLSEGTWFAGGLWTWTGFAPHNLYSMKASGAALASCLEHGVTDVFLTMWGDDGGECSRFAALPSLFYASRIAAGESDSDVIAAQFEKKYGVPFERFLCMDLPGTANGQPEGVANPDKYLLYNDCFIGLLDFALTGEEWERYEACAEKLAEGEKDPEWGYLFASQRALCRALAVKAGLGQRTRQAYQAGDREAMSQVIGEYVALEEKLEVFYEAYRARWFRENKAFGFEIQDIRLGGLIRRVEDCRRRLEAWQGGEIIKIEELEEAQLDYGLAREPVRQPGTFWHSAVSANRLLPA